MILFKSQQVVGLAVTEHDSGVGSQDASEVVELGVRAEQVRSWGCSQGASQVVGMAVTEPVR